MNILVATPDWRLRRTIIFTQRKIGEKEVSVFKDDVAFKYADNEDVLKKLAGLK